MRYAEIMQVAEFEVNTKNIEVGSRAGRLRIVILVLLSPYQATQGSNESVEIVGSDRPIEGIVDVVQSIIVSEHHATVLLQ